MALLKPSPALPPTDNYLRLGRAFDAIDANTTAVAQAQATADGKASAAAVGTLQQAVATLQNDVVERASQNALTDLQGDVRGKASQDAFDDLARTVANVKNALPGKADGPATAARLDALAAAQSEIASRVADLHGRLLREAASGLGRPGDAPARYALAATTSAAADLVSAPDIPAGMIVGSAQGLVVSLIGSAILASRTPIALEPDRLYRVRYVVARRANASDPAGDAVVPGLVYLDQSRRPIGSLVPPSPLDPTGSLVPIATLDMLIRASGRKQIEALVSRAPGLGAAFQAPAAARYAVPVLVTYGLDGVTDVEVLHGEDVTGAFVVAPPVAAFEARLANLESQDFGPRLTALESEVGTPSMLVFPSKGDASTGSIPAGVQFAQLLGGATPGDGRGGLYQRYTGTPPAGADQFTTTGGAVFLRVAVAAEIAAALLAIGYVPWLKGLPTDPPPDSDQPYFNNGGVAVTP